MHDSPSPPAEPPRVKLYGRNVHQLIIYIQSLPAADQKRHIEAILPLMRRMAEQTQGAPPEEALLWQDVWSLADGRLSFPAPVPVEADSREKPDLPLPDYGQGGAYIRGIGAILPLLTGHIRNIQDSSERKQAIAALQSSLSALAPPKDAGLVTRYLAETLGIEAKLLTVRSGKAADPASSLSEGKPPRRPGRHGHKPHQHAKPGRRHHHNRKRHGSSSAPKPSR